MHRDVLTLACDPDTFCMRTVLITPTAEIAEVEAAVLQGGDGTVVFP